LGDAWLRYSEAIRGAAKAARPGNGQEVAQVANLNGILNHGVLGNITIRTAKATTN